MQALLLLITASLAVAPVMAAPAEVMLHASKEDGVFHYIPDRAEVAPGGKVVLGHLFGYSRHSITSVDGLFNATGDASAWPEIQAPTEPGEYRFYCWIHATPETRPEDGMAGILVVGEPDAKPATPQPEPSGDGRGAPLPSLVATGLALAGLALARRKGA
jgi:plastocyanin